MSDPSEDTVEIYRDEAGEWRWKRLAANGEIVADSGEGYVNKQDCEDGAARQGVQVVFSVGP